MYFVPLRFSRLPKEEDEDDDGALENEDDSHYRVS